MPDVAIDLSDRQVQGQICKECGRTYRRVVIFATKNGTAYSVVSAQCHGHSASEVWLDATFGSWEEPFADHVTFSCRISEQGAGVVDALVASNGVANYYGHTAHKSRSPRAPCPTKALGASGPGSHLGSRTPTLPRLGRRPRRRVIRRSRASR